MENQDTPKSTRLTAIGGGCKEYPFRESFGLDPDGTLIYREDGSFESKGSATALIDGIRNTPAKRAAGRIAGWITSTHKRDLRKTSLLIGGRYDHLCAHVKGFDEAYYLNVRANTPMDLARINRMMVVQFTLRRGYSLTDKPSLIVRTLKSRWKLEMSPELRELIDLVKNDGRPYRTG